MTSLPRYFSSLQDGITIFIMPKVNSITAYCKSVRQEYYQKDNNDLLNKLYSICLNLLVNGKFRAPIVLLRDGLDIQKL